MVDITRTLAEMGALVKKGDFQEAAAIGNACDAPLGIAASELQLRDRLYQGQQGTVSSGRWRGQEVAVKKARIGTSADMERFRMEIRLLQLAGRHENVVPLLAARALPPDYMLVLPLLSANLAERLHTEGWRPRWGQVASVALQLARGLAHLHSCGIQHRDLKPANVLSGEGDNVAITDFGIAVLESELAAELADRQSLVGRGNPSGGFHKRHLVGTLEYLAPEVLLKQPYGFPADVYAWAVTVNEVATRVVPFSDCTKDNPAAHTVLNFGYGRQELAAAVVSEGLRPLMQPQTPPSLAQLLEDCWRLDPARRPTASRLVDRLAALIKDGDIRDRGEDMQQGPTTREMEEARRAAVVGRQKAVRKPAQERMAAPAWLDTSQLQDASPDHAGQLKVGVFATPGSRGADRMEDRHLLACPMDGSTPPAHLLAVFDGHRGAEAAQHAANHLECHLRDTWGNASAEAALQECFVGLDEEFREGEAARFAERQPRFGTSAGQPRWPGCTAIAALQIQNQLWVANAGDCRAVLCRGGKAMQLNKEHSAEDSQERQRVQQDGGKVQEVMGSWRIGDAGLQVTRSLGDGDLKGCGVVALPEVTHFTLGPDDTCLILASDGLWDQVSSQEAVDLVRDTVKEPTMCAQRLATQAITQGSGDNITVIVAFLQAVSTLERVFG